MTKHLKDRILWIDAARGFGILAVVMFHSGFLLFPEKVIPFIESWMLPIFIITGGLVFNPKRNILQFVLEKFRALMLPFFIFGAISLIGWLLINNSYAREAIWMPTDEALLFFLKGHDMWFNAPLWFLPSYFLCLIFARVINPFWVKVNAIVKISVVIGLIYLSSLVLKEGQRTFYSWDIALLFASFLLFATLFQRLKDRIILSPLIMLIVAVIFFAGLSLNEPVDVFLRHYNNFWLFWLNAVTGSLFMIQVGFYLSMNQFAGRTLTYLGKNSLLIMAIHWPVMQWLTFFLSFTGLFNYLQSKPLLTSFTFPRPFAIRLWILQIVLLILYTFSSVLILESSKRLYSAVKLKFA